MKSRIFSCQALSTFPTHLATAAEAKCSGENQQKLDIFIVKFQFTTLIKTFCKYLDLTLNSLILYFAFE